MTKRFNLKPVAEHRDLSYEAIGCTMADAIAGLTIGEHIQAYKQLGAPLDQADSVSAMAAVTWLYLNRNTPTLWDDVLALTVAQLQGMYLPDDTYTFKAE